MDHNVLFCGPSGSPKLFQGVLAIEAIFVSALGLHSLFTRLTFTLTVQKQWHLSIYPGGRGHCTPHLLELEEKKQPPFAIKNVFDEPVKNSKFIELQSSCTRLFSILCEEMGMTEELTQHPSAVFISTESEHAIV